MSERKSLIPEYGPFAGMRIIDTGSLVAMPFAATLLADFGAEVIHCLLYTSPSPRDRG